jgi:endonuclease/exonuclease/phosphatase family metal-dependent hydrolase
VISRVQEDPSVNIILIGDFNVIDRDFPHPFRDAFDRIFFPKYRLAEVHDLYMNDPSICDTAKQAMAPGTFFFARDKEWNRLDRFFVSQNLLSGRGLTLDVSTYQIYAPDFLAIDFVYTNEKSPHFGQVVKNVPYSVYPDLKTPENAGYSDHFAILMKLRYVN